MAYRTALRSVAVSIGLIACGVMGSAALRHGLWGSLAGSVLASVWLGAFMWRSAARRPRLPSNPVHASHGPVFDSLLLDAAPVPMLAIEKARARTLNRAARRLFATDDRILPTPPGLLDAETTHVRHEGRQWRVERVRLGDNRMVAALIDVEQEERAAEARATAEMIHVLGHELLNGLAPIVSLAESGEAMLARPDPDPMLLREILGTLARRAEGLLRFAEAYRALARLPEPILGQAPMERIADDLARLFASCWPQTRLVIEVDAGLTWPVDRDQLGQALWALMQNAAEAATKAKGDEAVVTLTMRHADAGLIVQVQDNGPGVCPEDAIQIFRPFHSTKAGGTGIGLSLAQQIAHAHGGTVTFQSGSLTTFRLMLP